MTILQIPSSLTLCKIELSSHKLFAEINSIERLRIFMQDHVYAVWDFMSLLKALQREITCVEIPWRPSSYSKSSVRFINEIVVGEESDLGLNGQAIDHFSMYLEAMDEIGANTNQIKEFITSLNSDLIPENVSPFVSYNLDLVMNKNIHQIAGAFFFGREDLIPSMFSGILEKLEQQNFDCPKLKHYLNRHIELDGDHHGPLASALLLELTQAQEDRLDEAFKIGFESLELRSKLWDSILAKFNG